MPATRVTAAPARRSLDQQLKVIATALITKVHQSVIIDWILRESARAKIKVIVKRILKQHGYPSDL